MCFVVFFVFFSCFGGSVKKIRLSLVVFLSLLCFVSRLFFFLFSFFFSCVKILSVQLMSTERVLLL